MDFGNFDKLISNLYNRGQEIAKMGGDKSFVDGTEVDIFTSEINAKAKESGVDASEIYNDAGIAGLFGAEFSRNVDKAGAKFNDTELDSMWALAGIPQPTETATTAEATVATLDAMAEMGLDITDLEELFADEPGVIEHTMLAFQNGSANRISKEVSEKEYGTELSNNFFDAMEYLKFNRGNV